MSSSFRAPPVPSSAEIDLVALFRTVWRQKILIMFIAVGVGLVAAVYAFTATPVYQVSSVLRPAAINELDALNRSEVYSLPPSAALLRLGASLESYETRFGFFRDNQSLFQAFVRPGRTLEQSFEEFNRDSIILTIPDTKKASSLSAFIRLDMSYPKGVDGVSILNNFVEFAITNERQQIAADMNVIVKNRLNELSGKLEAARSSYLNDKQIKIASLQEVDNLRRAQLIDELKALREQLRTQRNDRVTQLTEAIGIARSLGIEKPTTPTSLGDSGRQGGSVMRAEINNQQIPLYFMGVDALQAERTALMARKSDDFTEGRISQIAKELQLLKLNRQVEVLNQRKNEDVFLAGVEPLRAEMARLKNLNINLDGLKLVVVDQQALEPLRPVKPKKILIILLGLIAGGLLGGAIALGRSWMDSRSPVSVASPKAAVLEGPLTK
ncbi:Wzz/FepE/Etk N-terminal domain-containing protein [Pseudomonas veronii]|uniref:Wzz/FepE/Etk N-terminal domain-containing protein n=1 Tax=Pseudomonas veronii TaxID=76761 RepID=UPI0023DEDF60|nr:Wzz/FepE/Etk N-terminal domain-containing protein [Pseudomonas veronii]MDF3238316.1 Wzz/FepE/Etk N-terminal domain-containing protein [Pseudomonas veronii]